MDRSRYHRFILFRRLVAVAFLAVGMMTAMKPAAGRAADLAVVPLFDGERGELLNTWGGVWAVGTVQAMHLESHCTHSGKGSLCVELGPLSAGGSRYVQCLAGGFGQSRAYHQTRDLTRFVRLEFQIRNATGAPLGGFLQIKDDRDSPAHRAIYRFRLPTEEVWTSIAVPLAFGGVGWTVQGRPDLSRVLTIDFAFESPAALAGGRVYLDDLVLVEPGGPVETATSPLPALVERLARRQWDGLWAARSRIHSLVPNNSYQATDAGLNTTAGLLWMLPAAVRRGWVPQDEADEYVAALVQTVHRLRDRARYLPPRNVDWVTLEPSLLPEESSIDAGFLMLALHQYRCRPSTPATLRESIGRAQDRFDFASFACPGGWRMAYRYRRPGDREGFVAWTYNGYTNEADVVSLAAHLSRTHPVPIETYWNTDVDRVHARLAGLPRSPVVHGNKGFRAPFTQALINLFVDVRARGVDTFPDARVATNPWENFVCYEQSVMARLAEMGRRHLVQPDAGDDGTLRNYQQFSVYEDFGQGDLFMPWSCALALLAGADGADAALRNLLEHRLHGPLGLADSARWTTGAAEPHYVTARHDFWNTALSTMAFLEWLDGEARSSKSFAELPEVRAALDRVFSPKAAVAQATGGAGPG